MEGDHTSTIIHVILSMDHASIQLKVFLKILCSQTTTNPYMEIVQKHYQLSFTINSSIWMDSRLQQERGTGTVRTNYLDPFFLDLAPSPSLYFHNQPQFWNTPNDPYNPCKLTDYSGFSSSSSRFFLNLSFHVKILCLCLLYVLWSSFLRLCSKTPLSCGVDRPSGYLLRKISTTLTFTYLLLGIFTLKFLVKYIRKITYLVYYWSRTYSFISKQKSS